ncbi:ABC transporter ATP-binding protein [Parapusillimonas granuli]|uniref:ABC transporter ATP-binding protein n=1 Tax=Parapusillimonas granuli TaxID=380911 RepID=A0A853G1Q2_9BURK|nr:ABC transporter ATP-binding protein [Parapusillimonas granuli]MBB5215531.1 oligopeptide/dipeptide ABC transporter ATP-binding protein [Parapusillimonas granuli]NYT49802.1 ABC transporter ATP-binding protein [Parapusillimonas granuli]
MDYSTREPLLRVRNLTTQLQSKRGTGLAVKGVSFDLYPGETLGLVGESGSGKSLTCLSVLRLNPKPASTVTGGEVLFESEDLLRISDDEMRAYRGKKIGMILQDPMRALNPVLTIGDQLFESLRLHKGLRGAELRRAAAALLERVQIPNPEQGLSAYPHHFSGGMRQRVVGAIAMAGSPSVLIADEPTTALDVTVQAAFLDLLKRIQREEGLSILFVTHDFAVVARMCDRVAVMYAGRIVETAPTAALFNAPRHPYTESLLKSVPDVDHKDERLYTIPGQPPSIFSEVRGCAFAPRCPYVMERCLKDVPPQKESGPGHTVSCWRLGD